MDNLAQRTIALPAPLLDGKISIEKTLRERRSIRRYGNEALTLSEVSQVLWAAQGVTARKGYRTSPSAGALYPVEIFIVVGKVGNLSAGVYKYLPLKHALQLKASGDKRPELCREALNQNAITNAPVVVIISAVYERVTKKYGTRGIRYVQMEVGHVAQNILLQVVSLGMGAVPIGAFQDREIKRLLDLDRNEEPVYIIPFGKKRK